MAKQTGGQNDEPQVTKCNASQPGVPRPCVVCGKATDDRARLRLGGAESYIPLCAEHPVSACAGKV